MAATKPTFCLKPSILQVIGTLRTVHDNNNAIQCDAQYRPVIVVFPRAVAKGYQDVDLFTNKPTTTGLSTGLCSIFDVYDQQGSKLATVR
eukprot:7884269-Pyramimonas_sp.AAC.2